MFADVSFPISSFQIFSYKIPSELSDKILIGSTVNAPLGKRNVNGIVVNCYSEKKFQGATKEINSLLDEKPIIDKKLWKLINWLSSYYNTPIGLAAKVALPSNLSTTYEPKKRTYVKIGSTNYESRISGKIQKKIYKYLKSKNKLSPISDLKELTKYPLSICKALESKGAIEIVKKTIIPDIYSLPVSDSNKKIQLTNDQKNSIDKICQSLDKGIFDPFLLHGVTGSGKTEVFIEAAKHAISNGKSVIVLLPEISTTPQIASRFRSVFGDIVETWHSKLSTSSRGWIWRKICEGNYKIIIGARSAIFTPLKNIGLIIVDEEQESSYKQTAPDPKYHAREVALMRGKISNATVILSSATPSIESYYNYKKNKYKYLNLPDRIGNAKLPTIHLVDMIEENKKTEKYGSIFSEFMIQKIKDRINKNEQIILLHNRRGFAPILQCIECGEIALCPHCKLSMTYHKIDNSLKCHFCNYSLKVFDRCNVCQSYNVQLSGTGTQKVENELENLFPDICIDRLDLDSTPTASKIFKTLEKFSNNEINILIGTQMIAKGLDFANTTLVGIINSDTGLFLPDFRSGERVFQLIYQAAGRAGRGNIPGEVVVQTYNSNNQVIKLASKLDLVNYYEECLKERSELNYPPYSWLVRLEIRGRIKKDVETSIEKLNNKIPSLPLGIEKLGPAYCYREKLKDQYRMQIVIKSNKKYDPSGSKLQNLYKNTLKNAQEVINKNKSRLIIDVNPVSLL